MKYFYNSLYRLIFLMKTYVCILLIMSDKCSSDFKLNWLVHITEGGKRHEIAPNMITELSLGEKQI